MRVDEVLVNGVPIAVESIEWCGDVMHLPGGVRVTFGAGTSVGQSAAAHRRAAIGRRS